MQNLNGEIKENWTMYQQYILKYPKWNMFHLLLRISIVEEVVLWYLLFQPELVGHRNTFLVARRDYSYFFTSNIDLEVAKTDKLFRLGISLHCQISLVYWSGHLKEEELLAQSKLPCSVPGQVKSSHTLKRSACKVFWSIWKICMNGKIK